MRIKLQDRTFPNYTKGEEIFHMVSHIVGVAFGIAVLVLCVIKSAVAGDGWGIASSLVYGICMMLLYCMSSIYHGLRQNLAKKVFQVLDHCAIYFMIAGCYTPIALVGLRPDYPVLAWIVFGVVWGLTALSVTLTAVDLKQYRVFSMVCYIVIGWCVLAFMPQAVEVMGKQGMLYLLYGGMSYTVGAVLYGIGKKKRYMHSVFHLFVLLGSVLQFFAIYYYVL